MSHLKLDLANKKKAEAYIRALGITAPMRMIASQYNLIKFEVEQPVFDAMQILSKNDVPEEQWNGPGYNPKTLPTQLYPGQWGKDKKQKRYVFGEWFPGGNANYRNVEWAVRVYEVTPGFCHLVLEQNDA